MEAEVKSISARLKDIRIYYGYKQTDIARTLDICRNAYCEYEHYKRIIPLKRLIPLSNFYGINIDYLLGLTDTKIDVKPIEINRSIISDRLLEIRHVNNLSVAELASSLNVSEALIYYYESCEKLISTSVCYDLAKKYNVSIDYLLGRSSSKYELRK
jgi:transcriptional regulator with XRE-family HTH domain